MAKKTSHAPNIAHQINIAKQSLDSTPAWIRGDESGSVAKQGNSASSNRPAEGARRSSRVKT